MGKVKVKVKAKVDNSKVVASKAGTTVETKVGDIS